MRDGSHSVAHQYTPEQVAHGRAKLLDDAGVWAIAVGHGDGLGAGSRQYGFAAALRRRAARGRRARSSSGPRSRSRSCPGSAPRTTCARRARPARPWSGSRPWSPRPTSAIQHLRLARELGHDRPQPPEHGARSARSSRRSRRRRSSPTPAASGVYLVDSCGAFLPRRRPRPGRGAARGASATSSRSASTSTTTSRSPSPTASPRSQEGATIVDVTARRAWAPAPATARARPWSPCSSGWGSTPASTSSRSRTPPTTTCASELMPGPIVVDRLTATMGYADVPASFLLHAIRAGERFGVDPRDVILALGERQAVIGQEDMILDVAASLSAEHDRGGSRRAAVRRRRRPDRRAGPGRRPARCSPGAPGRSRPRCDGEPRALHLLTNSRAPRRQDGAYAIVRDAAAAAARAASEPRLVLRGDSTLRAHLLPEYAGGARRALPRRTRRRCCSSRRCRPPAASPATAVHWLVRDGAPGAARRDRVRHRRRPLATRRRGWSTGPTSARAASSRPPTAIEIGSPRSAPTTAPSGRRRRSVEAARGARPGGRRPRRRDGRRPRDDRRRAARAPGGRHRSHRALRPDLRQRPLRRRRRPAEPPLPALGRGLLVVVRLARADDHGAARRARPRAPRGAASSSTPAPSPAPEAAAAIERRRRARRGRARARAGSPSSPRPAPSRPRRSAPQARMRVARGLAEVVDRLRDASDVLLSKGGITSAVNVRDGLTPSARRSSARSPPACRCGSQPPTAITPPGASSFPGNVGDAETLAELVDRAARRELDVLRLVRRAARRARPSAIGARRASRATTSRSRAAVLAAAAARDVGVVLLISRDAVRDPRRRRAAGGDPRRRRALAGARVRAARPRRRPRADRGSASSSAPAR